jgi:hypothetical protein
MKKLVVLLALAGLMATGSAMAQDPGPDSFGLYFDEGVWTQNSTAGGGVLSAYMVIAGPTVGSCGGLEIQFEVAAAQGVVTGTTFLVDAIDIDARPEGVAAGFGTPIEAADGFIYLGTLNLVAFGTPTEIFAGPNDTASVPGYAAYLNGDVPELPIVTLNFSVDMDGLYTDPETGWLTVPLAVINGEAPVATEDATWSQVKGMFR